MSGSNDDVNIATVALVVSAVALVAAILQVLQQYYASAVGYSNCDEKVMGMWHLSKQRIPRLDELRFEVRFEAPVIFVAPPLIKRGPVSNAPIYMIDGTLESQKDTRAEIEKDDHGARKKELTQKQALDNSIHTADNERATWVNLLSALQRMEKESMEWQAKEFAKNPPTGRPIAGREQHTLAVKVQRKLRSWDTMPSNVKKPYATTTICHMIEMTAILGLHWKVFDRANDKYRAEGNGFMIYGSSVSDLGIMFTFQVSGKSKFEANRVIPVDQVKELCFGFVPTMFRDAEDIQRLELPSDQPDEVDANDTPKELEFLHLGTFTEIAETLTLLKCNQNTVNYFLQPFKKHAHLFPVAFELVGMLGKTLHIPNSCFRMLPNPTPFAWEDKSFSLRKILRSLKNAIRDDELSQQWAYVHEMEAHIKKIETSVAFAKKELTCNMPLTEHLHNALDFCDDYLRRKESTELVLLVLRIHIEEVLRNLNDAPPLQGFHSQAGGAPENLQPPGGAAAAKQPGGVGSSSSSSSSSDDSTEPFYLPRFEDLNSATTDQKQDIFMDVYFEVIRPEVLRQYKLPRRTTTAIGTARNSGSLMHPGAPFGGSPSGGNDFLAPRHTPHHSTSSAPASILHGSGLAPAPAGGAASPATIEASHHHDGGHPHIVYSHSSPQTLTMAALAANNAANAAAAGPSSGMGLPTAHTAGNTGVPLQLLTPTRAHRAPSIAPSDIDGRSILDLDRASATPTPGGGFGPGGELMRDVRANGIWCTLVFRMLCWLMLHDFHRRDVQQVGKSELWGSRLPVYIG